MTPEQRRAALAERFHTKYEVVTETGCWVWMAWDNGRYGKISVGGVDMLAHRVSYFLHYGCCPPDKVVLHVCDNPLCVNPAHLTLGTQGDNMRDMVAKGRHGRQNL